MAGPCWEATALPRTFRFNSSPLRLVLVGVSVFQQVSDVLTPEFPYFYVIEKLSFGVRTIATLLKPKIEKLL